VLNEKKRKTGILRKEEKEEKTDTPVGKAKAGRKLGGGNGRQDPQVSYIYDIWEIR